MVEKQKGNINKDKEPSLISKWEEQMNLITEKTGIPGNYVIGGLVLSVIFVSIGFLDRFITNLVGTLYPAYWTMKSIESKGDDDKQWLTYWVVFACFTIVEIFLGFLLKFIPFYFFLKIIFLIWLFMPNSMGCHYVYHLLVVKVFKTFEHNIDNATGKLGEFTRDLVNQGTSILDHNKTNFISKAVNVVASEVIKSEKSETKTEPSAEKKKKKEDKKDISPFAKKKEK
jgi:receptor expression-enhancing protein 5/6